MTTKSVHGASRTSAHDRGRPTASDLVVTRRGIRFRDVGPGAVEIEVDVENVGDRPAPPAPVFLRAAAFGAFVRWGPPRRLVTGWIDPGETWTLRARAERETAPPGTDAGGAIPPGLLTATAAGDEGRSFARELVERIDRTVAGPGLPMSTFLALRRESKHWAGNIGVFVGGHSVERHVGRLRFQPGKWNSAMFQVGGRADEYSFRAEGEGRLWESQLIDVSTGHTVEMDVDGFGSWYRLLPPGVLVLGVRPPATCERGRFEVHVRQRSSGRSTHVEFDLDASARGPGCYVA